MLAASPAPPAVAVGGGSTGPPMTAPTIATAPIASATALTPPARATEVSRVRVSARIRKSDAAASTTKATTSTPAGTAIAGISHTITSATAASSGMRAVSTT